MSCGCQNTEIEDFCPDAPDETVDALAEVTTSQPLHRRTLLKVAAAGATVAAFAGRNGFSTPSAMADDLSTFQCTAGDVEIIGTGIITNEPCNCPAGTTFSANVSFTVRNNAASDRGCITLHLVPVTLPNGTVFTPADISLGGSIAGKETKTMSGTVNNYPCGAGLICFGSPSADGRRRCDPGTCGTVSWTVPGQDTCPPDRQISSKCRHQQICIQGRSTPTLECVTSCAVPCGGNGTVRLCTSGPGPHTFALDGQSFGPTSDTCHDFTVGPLTQNRTLSGTVTTGGCTRTSNEVTLTVTAVGAATLGVGTADCDGDVTYTVSNCDSSLTYTYKEVNCTTGAQIGSNLGGGVGVCELTHRFPRDGANHCVAVSVANAAGTCTAGSNTVSTLVRTPVTFRLRRTTGCSGVVTLIAEAEGGTGTFTYSFFVGTSTTPAQTGSSNEMVVQPQLDGNCRSFRVAVVDSAGCAGTATEDGGTPNPARDTVTFSQCVTTTTC